MFFGEVPLSAAEGALLAHSVMLSGKRVAKGALLTADLIASARAEGLETLWVARPGEEDIPEAEAASRIGAALAGPGVEARSPVHGRVNLHALHPGLFLLRHVEEANRLADAIGIATLPPFSPVAEGALLATVKVIPFAVPRATLAALLATSPRLEVLGWRQGATAAILITRPPHGETAKADGKAREVTAARLRALGIDARAEGGIPHAVQPLATALAAASEPLILIAGAAATADPADVIPAAIRAAGGEVLRVGMPVDPGNLLVLGRRGGQTLIGLPGCARSPQRNGLDLVLERWAAGLDVTAETIAGMGIGGLLEGSGAAVPWAFR
ncbi:molybdopterin biosynthesis enzyme [Thermaurantiacus sp.]